ncbi:MAG: hypothetical protein WD008_01020 [Balneolaceae bacterium]
MRLLITVFLLLIPSLLSAQVLNVEKVRSDSDSTGWTGEVAVDFSINKFNERIIKLGNEANAAYFSDNHSYLLLSSLELVNVDGNSLISNGYVHFRTTFLRKKTFSPELFLQYQYNDNYGLQNRALAGAGIKYSFLSRPKLTGHFFTGLMSETEEWGLENNQTVTNQFIKSTSNIVLRGELRSGVSLLVIGYYQARPDRFFQPRVTSENQLNLPISERLTFRVSFVTTFDVDPIIDVPKLTYELKNGLVLSF